LGDIFIRMRVLTYLPSRASTDDLHRALIDAGCEPVTVDDLDDLTDQMEPDEPVLVVFDETVQDWLTFVTSLVQVRPSARPVLLAQIDDPDAFLCAVMAGVVGFCDPDSSVDAIVRTVKSVCEFGIAIPRGMAEPLVTHVRLGRGYQVQTDTGKIYVTDREWEILSLLMQGRSTKEMAETLFVSQATVRGHVSTVLKKLGAVDREDAIALVRRNQLP
jgi:DNA-binding NarL/FixJ family response regulator